MDKENFIKYMAYRYGIDEDEACGITNFFADCLQELINAGVSVNIDEIGEFKTSSLFAKELKSSHPALARLSTTKVVRFIPSKNLTITDQVA